MIMYVHTDNLIRVMGKKIGVFVVLLFLCLWKYEIAAEGAEEERGTKDMMEKWGYVQVRPKAHMFWWHYCSPNRVHSPDKPWPIILWLQGGPGASGVGIGNFQEVGPLNTNLKPRNFTWLMKADLLFVDSPVGTGYSFVEDDNLFVKTDEEAAVDLTTLLIKLFNKNPALQASPLYVVAESYGGKHAVTLGLTVTEAINSGRLKMKLGGIALGDSWISPEDFVLSWGPLLKDVSRLDTVTADKVISMAISIKQMLKDGQYKSASDGWSNLETYISTSSNDVDFYNFLLDQTDDPLAAAATTIDTSESYALVKYKRYLQSVDVDISYLLNTKIRKKLKIIPQNVTWGGQSNSVFSNLYEDFMKPRIAEVDKLLRRGINVTIYNGQLDVICSTKGTEAWVKKLKWEGMTNFFNTPRTPLYCGDQSTRGFLKSYQNLRFYWILNAGHFVPVSQPCLGLKMIGEITNSPANS